MYPTKCIWTGVFHFTTVAIPVAMLLFKKPDYLVFHHCYAKTTKASNKHAAHYRWTLPSNHFNIVVFRLIWNRDVAQREMCTSTLKFTTFNNVETKLCISTLNWTTLDNFEITLSFSTSIFTTLDNVKTTLRIWTFEKKLSLDSKTK